MLHSRTRGNNQVQELFPWSIVIMARSCRVPQRAAPGTESVDAMGMNQFPTEMSLQKHFHGSSVQ
jgi:hypothetical protein